MLSLFKELDFSSEIEENKDLKLFILEACKKVEQEESELLRKIRKPELDDELLNQFIINGIPVLKPDNEEKFLALFRTKILDAKKIGEKQGLLTIEVGRENGIGNQTLYMTYRTTAEARAAFNKLNNFKFDKNHTLQCFTVNDIRGFIEEQEQHALERPFSTPAYGTTEQKIQHNLDEQLRNQFVVRQGNQLYLNWLDHLDKSANNALPTDSLPVDFTINKAVFSPLGSYLAVCSPQGTHLYFGSKLLYKGFLPQVDASDAKFSPDERIIVTSNGGSTASRENFIVWAVEEQIKMKTYKSHSGQSLDCFQFSEDARSLAVILQHEVIILGVSSVEEFKRQVRLAEEEQHLIKALHVQKVAWIRGGWLMVMCYELDYNPTTVAATRLFLYNVETRQERKWRAWSEHAKNGEIFVSERGDWVAISLRKFIKKNHFATVIQVGNLLRKEEPLEISSVEVREEVDSISWDWHNNRFAVVSEDESTKRGINVRFVVAFYDILFKNKSIEITKVGELRDNLQNRVVLASNGNFFALYNTTEESPEKGKFSLGLISREGQKGKRTLAFQFTKQNLMVSGMSFFHVDPSGRFILLGTEKGYQIWNFIGEIITKDTLQKNIHDVQWRPRVMTQLPEQEERALIEGEKEVRRKYEEMDDKRINFLKYEKEAARKQQKEYFLQFVAKKNEWFRQFSDLRTKALGFKEFEVRTQKYEVSEAFIDIR